jgi:hypothetical protein
MMLSVWNINEFEAAILGNRPEQIGGASRLRQLPPLNAIPRVLGWSCCDCRSHHLATASTLTGMLGKTEQALSHPRAGAIPEVYGLTRPNPGSYGWNHGPLVSRRVWLLDGQHLHTSDQPVQLTLGGSVVYGPSYQRMEETDFLHQIVASCLLSQIKSKTEDIVGSGGVFPCV